MIFNLERLEKISIFDKLNPLNQPKMTNFRSNFLFLAILFLVISSCSKDTNTLITDSNTTENGVDEESDENSSDENNDDENNDDENGGDENGDNENNGDENNGDENGDDENNGDENNGEDDTANYEIRSVFGTTETLEVRTKGIFAIWWDKKFDHEEDAKAMFTMLNEVRRDCLEDLGMQDPPNPRAGFYFNVYIHHGAEDNFPNNWNNGVGTDSNQMPYLSLPVDYHINRPNLYHEGLHIFQYSQNSPGFRYEGDSLWYTETTAQWFSADRNPDNTSAFVEVGTISSNPQLTLWHSINNEVEGDPKDWLYLVRQYGLHSLLYYLHKVANVPSDIFTNGFYEMVNQRPQQYLFEQIGHAEMRSHFADWAAANTAGFTYITPAQWQRAQQELVDYADPDNMHPFAIELNGSNIIGTHTPNQNFLPRNWGYNVVKVSNVTAGSLNFTLNGAEQGAMGTPSHFESRILLKSNSGDRYIKVDMSSNSTGSKTFTVNPGENELFVIIAAVPEQFEGNQTYNYSINFSR